VLPVVFPTEEFNLPPGEVKSITPGFASPASSGGKDVLIPGGDSVVRLSYHYELYGPVRISLESGEYVYAATLQLKVKNEGTRRAENIAWQQDITPLAGEVENVLGCEDCVISKGSVLATLFFDNVGAGEEKNSSVSVKINSPVINKQDVLNRLKQPTVIVGNNTVSIAKTPGQAEAERNTTVILGLIAGLAILTVGVNYFFQRR